LPLIYELRTGNKIGEHKEQTLEAKNKQSDSEPVSLKTKEVRIRTLRKLAAPNREAQPLSIIYVALDKPLKLNSGFINLLPKFHGLAGEDLYCHIGEFLITCSAMMPEGFLNTKLG